MSSLKPLKKNFISTFLSLIFRALVALKNFRYSFFSPKKRKFPVISVGGISTGGTGKTPLTALIIEELLAAEKTPVLLSRGYGRISKKIEINPPFQETKWEIVGDEPAMLKKRYPQLWLGIDGDRTAVATILEEQLPPNSVFIMDDGFQHRKFYRDLDIVTLPNTILDESLIPIGLMREPLSSLKRADILVIIGNDNKNILENLKNIFEDKTIFSATLLSENWINSSTNEKRKKLVKPTHIFASIARPERFFADAKASALVVEKPIIFPDHHIFSEDDYKLLSSLKSDEIGTTEKDRIRLNKDFLVKQRNLWYLTVKVEFKKSILEFRKKILHTVREREE